MGLIFIAITGIVIGFAFLVSTHNIQNGSDRSTLIINKMSNTAVAKAFADKFENIQTQTDKSCMADCKAIMYYYYPPLTVQPNPVASLYLGYTGSLNRIPNDNEITMKLTCNDEEVWAHASDDADIMRFLKSDKCQ